MNGAQDNEALDDSACEPWRLQTVSVPSLTRSFIRHFSEVLATALRSTVIFPPAKYHPPRRLYTSYRHASLCPSFLTFSTRHTSALAL